VTFWQSFIAAALVIVILVCLAACGQNQILTALTAVLDAAEIALPIIGPSAGLTPEQLATIMAYLKAVADFTGQASLILASTDTPAQKSVAILKAAQTIEKGCNCLPQGISIQVDGAISAVEQAVEIFLRNFKPTVVPKTITLTATNRAKLTQLRARSETLKTKVQGATK
jgi:hypothetical protein